MISDIVKKLMIVRSLCVFYQVFPNEISTIEFIYCFRVIHVDNQRNDPCLL
jgi:hypothetical protein